MYWLLSLSLLCFLSTCICFCVVHESSRVRHLSAHGGVRRATTIDHGMTHGVPCNARTNTVPPAARPAVDRHAQGIELAFSIRQSTGHSGGVQWSRKQQSVLSRCRNIRLLLRNTCPYKLMRCKRLLVRTYLAIAS
jgi:hypothetical protein